MANPKTLGACVDKLYRIKEKKTDLSRLIAKVAAKETRQLEKAGKEYQELEAHITGLLKKEKSKGTKGKIAQVSIKKTNSPNISDRKKLAQFIIDNEAYELISSISAPAWRTYLEDGKKVGGVTKFPQNKLSLTKLLGVQ